MCYGTSEKNLYLNGELVTELVIPDSVTSIGDWAFGDCSNLTSITIPDGVTSIGYSAFYNCDNLRNVIIGNGVTSIGDRAFSGCNKLKYNEKDGLKYLGNENNLYLCLIETETTDITTATIDSGCKFIHSSAFKDCSSLMSITIPDSVTSIGDYAFYNCSSLKIINFNGTMEQWKAIKKGYSWNYKVPATKVVCSDGEVAL